MQKRRFWNYGLFQIPAIFLFLCAIFIATVQILKPSCMAFWAVLALGLFMIALSWTLVMPLDLFFRSVMNWSMSLSGRMSISQAIFISALIGVILVSDLPTLRRLCDIPESMWYLRLFIDFQLY